MARNWFPEERQRQAALIREQKPWEKSTGPKTSEGKQAVRHNGLKHGFRSAEMRALCRLLAAQRAHVRAVLAAWTDGGETR